MGDILNPKKNPSRESGYGRLGLAGNEHIKQRAVDTLRKYGLGSCGPPGFYGTLGRFSFPSLSFGGDDFLICLSLFFVALLD